MRTTGSPSASATAGPSPRWSDSTTRAGSWRWPRCSAVGQASRAPSRRPGSSSIGPERRAADRSGHGQAEARGRVAAPTLDRTIDDYLDFLRVERGLADATLTAYRSDLTDYRRVVPDGRSWATTPDTAVAYLATRTRRGAPGERPLAPTSLRRRAAALKGFYRFAYGEGLIDIDVAAHLDLPRPVRRLPDTLDVDDVERLLEAASVAGVRDRALLELLYAAGLRV